jgi:beta-phosphoglucomutase-like phosphatase (HAD superfamily)
VPIAPEAVATVVEMISEVAPEEATHVAVRTRVHPKFHRVGRVFTPNVVEIDIAREWPDPQLRSECLQSLSYEAGPKGCLEVEFIKR